MQNLDGNITADLRSARSIDFSHSPATHERTNHVMIEPSAFQRGELERGDRQSPDRSLHELDRPRGLAKKRFDLTPEFRITGTDDIEKCCAFRRRPFQRQ